MSHLDEGSHFPQDEGCGGGECDALLQRDVGRVSVC